MEAQEFIFILTRPAKNLGGDRYEAEVGNSKPMVIYIPQSISRQDGAPASELTIRFTPVT